MERDYSVLATNITEALQRLNQALPETMGHFSDFGEIALKDSALDKKTKSIIALAIAIAKKSIDCVLFHLQNLIHCGITRQELIGVIAVASYMDGGPALIFSDQVLAAYDQLSKQKQPIAQEQTKNQTSGSTQGYE